MEVEFLPLLGLAKIVPLRLGDHRGYFSEVFRDSWFRENVADFTFVQENESLSAAVGTVRGLHFQRHPFAQGKLVRCTAGRIFDVAVDIRAGSPTYGKWYSTELSPEGGAQLWIPPGFAHGFVTLVPNCVISYKVTAPYDALSDSGLLWNDPDIGIEWPLTAAELILSEKDKNQPRLADKPAAFQY